MLSYSQQNQQFKMRVGWRQGMSTNNTVKPPQSIWSSYQTKIISTACRHASIQWQPRIPPTLSQDDISLKRTEAPVKDNDRPWGSGKMALRLVPCWKQNSSISDGAHIWVIGKPRFCSLVPEWPRRSRRSQKMIRYLFHGCSSRAGFLLRQV